MGEPKRKETIYGITSCFYETCDESRLLDLVRGHWTIENQLHWVRDVTYDEDRSQVRTGSGPQAMATLRNLAISLLRLAGHASLPKAMRYFATRPHEVLSMIGA